MKLARTSRALLAATALTLALGAGYAGATGPASDGIVHIDNTVPAPAFDPNGGTVAAPADPAPAPEEAPKPNRFDALLAGEGKASTKIKAEKDQGAEKPLDADVEAPKTEKAPAEDKPAKPEKDEC